ncbi:MAG: TetR/AcrR family transcriptional regulator [Acidobacteriota bacterium]
MPEKPPTVSDDHRAVDIYREAARIIHERGFDATSMGDIAEAVDLTKGGLYYYIKGKKALLYAIMDFAMRLIDENVIAPAEAESDPARRLARILSGHARLMVEEVGTMSILAYEEEGLDTAHRARIQERKQAYHTFIRDTVEMLMQTSAETVGEDLAGAPPTPDIPEMNEPPSPGDEYKIKKKVLPLPPITPRLRVDSDLAAASLLGIIHFVVRWFGSNPEVKKGVLITQITNLCLYGLVRHPLHPDDGAVIAELIETAAAQRGAGVG